MTMAKRTALENKAINAALRLMDDSRDDRGVLNLTQLDENVMDDLDLDDEAYEDADLSFAIFTYLAQRGLLPDD
jgi:hypothetical protein